MMDDTGNFIGVAAKELERECDIVISEEELVDLTALAYGDKFRGMMPSVRAILVLSLPDHYRAVPALLLAYTVL